MDAASYISRHRPTEGSLARYDPASYYESRSEADLGARYRLQACYLTDRTSGRVLDVGCAKGDWLSIMARHGWETLGLEFFPTTSPRADVTIVHSSFPDDDVLEMSTFDVITAWAVFEHLPSPRLAFARAAELLRPGGSLIILVPKASSVASRWAFSEDLPRHFFFFTTRTLGAYAAAAGLELRQIDHHPHLFNGAGRGALRVRAL